MPAPKRSPWQLELQPHIGAYSDAYAASQYHHLASDADIELFLQNETLWDNTTKEWTAVTKSSSLEELRARVRDVINVIIAKLGAAPPHDSSTREAFTTFNTPMVHVERFPCQGGGKPAVVVRASGPSFEDPLDDGNQRGPLLGFSNAATYMDVGQESHMTSDDIRNALNSSIYARQIFFQQPNRRFVRSLLLSEEFCQLFHFDRSGAQYTPPFSIHEDVKTFIRVVLGLSSYDEAELGLDTGVQWTIEGGRKVGGSITVVDASGGQVTYSLCDVNPSFLRYDFHGRGTTGWRVRSPVGTELFIKDCWRPASGSAEYDTLAHISGQQGVAQMLSFETRERTTADLRANGDNSWTMEGFSNRVSTRLVMESCGKSIDCFESQKQLVSAMRDAIAAHQALVNVHDVLHRDISQNNILLGEPGARLGSRGKLIDFDMAFRGPRPLGQTPQDLKAGTLFYMSVSLLSSKRQRTPQCTPFHDQFDDLESFYYVLYDLVFSYAGIRTKVQELPLHVELWGAETIDECAIYKRAHFTSPPDVTKLSPFWLPPTVELLTEFYHLTTELVETKHTVHNLVASRFPSGTYEDKYRDLLRRADEYYLKVLAIFDKAIEGLESEETDAGSCDPDNTVFSLDQSAPALPNESKKIDEHDSHSNPPPDNSRRSNGLPEETSPDPSTDGACSPHQPSVTAAESKVPPVNGSMAIARPNAPSTFLKRPVTHEFDDESGPPPKRSRATKVISKAVNRRLPWVRTTPHRTRAWCKANPHLLN